MTGQQAEPPVYPVSSAASNAGNAVITISRQPILHYLQMAHQRHQHFQLPQSKLAHSDMEADDRIIAQGTPVTKLAPMAQTNSLIKAAVCCSAHRPAAKLAHSVPLFEQGVG